MRGIELNDQTDALKVQVCRIKNELHRNDLQRHDPSLYQFIKTKQKKFNTTKNRNTPPLVYHDAG